MFRCCICGKVLTVIGKDEPTRFKWDVEKQKKLYYCHKCFTLERNVDLGRVIVCPDCDKRYSAEKFHVCKKGKIPYWFRYRTVKQSVYRPWKPPVFDSDILKKLKRRFNQ